MIYCNDYANFRYQKIMKKINNLKIVLYDHYHLEHVIFREMYSVFVMAVNKLDILRDIVWINYKNVFIV